MIRIILEDFIFEVKDEILSYEELGQLKADEWEQKFIKFVDDKNKDKKNTVYCCIQDESEIFDIVDEFYYSNEQNSLASYWNNFNLKLQFK